jgi:CheY-like chemotaxis protein
MGRPMRVLIVDDDQLLRSSIRHLVESDADVVAEAGDGAEALRLNSSLRPDLILIDLEMPVLDGIATTRELRRDGTGPQVIMISGTTDRSARRRARAAGAAAFVAKATLTSDLPAALLALAREQGGRSDEVGEAS